MARKTGDPKRPRVISVNLAAASKAQLDEIQDRIRTSFPEAGFSVRDRTEPSPNVSRQLKRFSQFLTLVGITTLMIGGVGVANAIAAYIDRKRGVIAAFKCLGASSRTIFATYLTQVMILALVAQVLTFCPIRDSS